MKYCVSFFLIISAILLSSWGFCDGVMKDILPEDTIRPEYNVSGRWQGTYYYPVSANGRAY